MDISTTWPGWVFIFVCTLVFAIYVLESWETLVQRRVYIFEYIYQRGRWSFFYAVSRYSFVIRLTVSLSLHDRKASSQASSPLRLGVEPIPSHLSLIILHTRCRTICSTFFSFLINPANASVLASFGKYLAEYGSSLSSIIRLCAFIFSASRATASGSDGSGDVATTEQ